jgi:hypothetical protein
LIGEARVFRDMAFTLPRPTLASVFSDTLADRFYEKKAMKVRMT